MLLAITRVLLVLAVVILVLPAAARAANPVQVENALPGTTSWLYGRAAPGAVEGYASEVSVLPGDTLHFHVSTNPPQSYRIEVYRLGWYGGTGARLLACSPACSGAEVGAAQPIPAPDANGLVRADWPVTDVVPVGSDWVSGYDVAKIVLLTGDGAGTAATVPFIVRAPAGRRTPILVQAGVNTWQAYNPWGGT